jgi:hypothetical protein
VPEKEISTLSRENLLILAENEMKDKNAARNGNRKGRGKLLTEFDDEIP